MSVLFFTRKLWFVSAWLCVCFTAGIFDDDFIEERKKGLEEFVNK